MCLGDFLYTLFFLDIVALTLAKFVQALNPDCPRGLKKVYLAWSKSPNYLRICGG